MRVCLLLITFFSIQTIQAQKTPRFDYVQQFFDGEDTFQQNNLYMVIPDTCKDVWFVGDPDKTKLINPRTFPNAIYTSNSASYGPNLNDYFQLNFETSFEPVILGFNWFQKIDFDNQDGGVIEWSQDGGKTWENALIKENIDNFYGFDTANLDTLFNGQLGFTGRDSNWRHVWLCFFDRNFDADDTTRNQFRFKIYTDSTSNSTARREGWLIDNFVVDEVLFHTAINPTSRHIEGLEVAPNPGNGHFNITIPDAPADMEVYSIKIYDHRGVMIQAIDHKAHFNKLDLSNYPAGNYYLQVKSNLGIANTKIVKQ